jgi:hypothetical protein
VQTVEQTLDVGFVLEDEIMLGVQQIRLALISFLHNRLQIPAGSSDFGAIPKMPIGREEYLQAVEFRPWIWRSKINFLEYRDGILETTLVKGSEPRQVATKVTPAWIDPLGRVGVGAPVLRLAIEEGRRVPVRKSSSFATMHNNTAVCAIGVRLDRKYRIRPKFFRNALAANADLPLGQPPANPLTMAVAIGLTRDADVGRVIAVAKCDAVFGTLCAVRRTRSGSEVNEQPAHQNNGKDSGLHYECLTANSTLSVEQYRYNANPSRGSAPLRCLT